jgi:hypothetical protein
MLLRRPPSFTEVLPEPRFWEGSLGLISRQETGAEARAKMVVWWRKKRLVLTGPSVAGV